jgi:hypothetical protein
VHPTTLLLALRDSDDEDEDPDWAAAIATAGDIWTVKMVPFCT